MNNLTDEHQYVKLSVGKCHYRIDGPSGGSTILLLHGATVAGWIFERLVPYFNQAGIRTLTIDLMGHGYSARPKTVYNLSLFKQQIMQLLDEIRNNPAKFDSLDVESPISILGHSLGAAIAASLVADHPAKFNRVILTAPLVNFNANMPIVTLFKTPLLGELLNRIYVIPMLKRRRQKRYASIADGRFVNKFMSQFLLPGFEQTVLSLFRSGVLDDQTQTYQSLNEINIPCQVLRGSDDVLVKPEQITYLKTLLPNAAFKEIENTAHAFILSHPELLAEELVAFIKK
ncbi:alpha/beta fold hydrolase [Aliikangiella maris]|uniref:Alpha/beta hydrolase n=2 Tax=Aliikangiella maris TaxID=3162458 RepID=A0ABV2BRP5_9GAMM